MYLTTPLLINVPRPLSTPPQGQVNHNMYTSINCYPPSYQLVGDPFRFFQLEGAPVTLAHGHDPQPGLRAQEPLAWGGRCCHDCCVRGAPLLMSAR